MPHPQTDGVMDRVVLLETALRALLSQDFDHPNRALLVARDTAAAVLDGAGSEAYRAVGEPNITAEVAYSIVQASVETLEAEGVARLESEVRP